MLKILLGLVAALAISGVAYGAATTLNVTPGALQQGTLGSADLSCDDDGVSISYHTTFISNEVRLLTVFVDGVDAACKGGELDVLLRDGSGNALWWGGADLPTSFAGGQVVAGSAVVYSGTLTAIEPVQVESVDVYIYDVYP